MKRIFIAVASALLFSCKSADKSIATAPSPITSAFRCEMHQEIFMTAPEWSGGMSISFSDGVEEALHSNEYSLAKVSTFPNGNLELLYAPPDSAYTLIEGQKERDLGYCKSCRDLELEWFASRVKRPNRAEQDVTPNR